MYTYSQQLSHFVPFPENRCFLDGLVIKRCVPESIKRAFSVTIIGRLDCSSSDIMLMMKRNKTDTTCEGGWRHVCKLRDVTKPEDGRLTTCVAECRCKGDDCRTLTIHISSYEDTWNWTFCEISLTNSTKTPVN